MQRRFLPVWAPWLLTAHLVPSAVAQLTYSQRSDLEDRRDSHSAAYDPSHGRVVQFGGLADGKHLGTTAAFDGHGLIRFTGPAPKERQNAMCCQHPTRGSLLLFGGRASDGSLFGDTWVYRDGGWSYVTNRGPSARWLGAMVLDSFRGVTVLHGGGDVSGPLADTWEYSTQGGWVAQSKGPTRANHAMAYDSLRHVTVLFGGYDNGSQSDHWEYSGGKGWVQVPVQTVPPARHNHAMCFDAARGRVVLFGGKDDRGRLFEDTWEFDGKSWTPMKVSGPSARELCALTYDEARRVCVLTGGDADPSGKGTLGDVWTWNGKSWQQQLTPPPAAAWLPARSQHAAVYDLARNQTVLHGGLLSNGAIDGGTWIYDGANWLPRDSSNGPGARFAHRMAYMQYSGKTILFGGFQSPAMRNDTFEWDGTAWRQLTPANAPSPRGAMAMTYDLYRDRVVLFGGNAGGFSYFNDTWEFDGTNWIQRSPANSPALRQHAAIAYDWSRRKAVLYGGYGPSGPLNDTWEYDGTNWTQIAMTSSPPAQFGGAMAYDGRRGVTVLALGGFAYEYDVDHRAWVQRNPTSMWPMTFAYPMVFDDQHKLCLLVGGQLTSQTDVSDAVYAWDGSRWSLRARPAQPVARGDHAMAYEPTSRRALLFGGHDGSAALQDTWTFDGRHWQLEQPRVVPSRRYAHAMTATPFSNPSYGTVWLTGGIDSHGLFRDDSYVWHPPSRSWRFVAAEPFLRRHNHAMARMPGTGYPMLFGGYHISGVWRDDTVAFDGTSWKTVVTNGAPPARDIHTMAYDERRGVVVLFGGRSPAQAALNDTWEFDGTRWTQVFPPIRPLGRWNAVLSYDPHRARIVLTGGRFGNSNYMTDIWEYDGKQWVERKPNTTLPPESENAAVAFDVQRARMLLHGGNTAAGPFGGTWEYFAPTDVGTFDAWTGGKPLTVLDAPILGAEFRVQYEATGGFGALMIHAGPSHRPLLPLAPPLVCELSALHIDLTAMLQLPGSGNPCVSSILVPNDTGFLGHGFAAQGIGVNTQPCLKLSLPMAFTLQRP